MARSSEPSTDSVVPRVLAHLRVGAPRLGETRLLCVDGPAGSGKTTLASKVHGALNASGAGSTLLHLDHLYRGWDDLAATPARVRADLLEPIMAGRPGRYRRWDWPTSRLAEEHLVTPSPYLVIEGVGAGAQLLATFATTLVWLDLDTATRKRRALARDGETFAAHWERWTRQERGLFARERTWERAHLVVKTT